MVNKRDIATEASSVLDCSIENAADLLNVFLKVIESNLLQGRDINIHGLGKFSIVKRASKKGINPRTLETIQVPGYSTVKFKAAKPLVDAVKETFPV